MIAGSFAPVLFAAWMSLLPAQAASAAPARTPTTRAPAKTLSAAPAKIPVVRARAHGISLSGRLSALDSGKKTLSVRDAAGRETSLVWTAATKFSGGNLKVGESITLRYFDRDTRHVATIIRIGQSPAAGPAGTPGAAALPSPPPS